ncbi:MAG: molecular chaperone [Pseudomonadales bacterium]|jgi:hypothetical chaperone protein|nr:molecular chaperone [Pseudomonadales bacterium]
MASTAARGPTERGPTGATPVGIDWGTSSSSIGLLADGQARLILLDGAKATRMPSTVWVPRSPPGDAPTDDLGRARVLTPQLVRRGALRFGEAASQAMLEGEDGFYVKSPKSFLGAELRAPQIENFTALVARMLGALLDAAAPRLGERPRRAVIGRPVRYHGNRGERGDAQALSIMADAAREAGLEEFVFLLEPIAAAYAYEATLSDEQLVLVIDAGGGTTDLTLIRLGPDRRERIDRSADVLGTAGDRVGGTDLDARLGFRAFTPELGRGDRLQSGLPMPNHYYVDLCDIADVNAQARFASDATGQALADYRSRAEVPDRIDRFCRLHGMRGAFRFNRAAETAKIALSSEAVVPGRLAWLDPALSPTASREDLAWAATPLLDRVAQLAERVIAEAGARPDRIFVTGGTAFSPVVAEGLRARLGADEIVAGDLFGSVAAGLGMAAARISG